MVANSYFRFSFTCYYMSSEFFSRLIKFKNCWSKNDGKRTHDKQRCRWDSNNKLNMKCEYFLIHPAQNKVGPWDLVNTKMGFHNKREKVRVKYLKNYIALLKPVKYCITSL